MKTRKKMGRPKGKKELIRFTVAIDPKSNNWLEKQVNAKPHLNKNAIINQIVEEKMAQRAG